MAVSDLRPVANWGDEEQNRNDETSDALLVEDVPRLLRTIQQRIKEQFIDESGLTDAAGTASALTLTARTQLANLSGSDETGKSWQYEKYSFKTAVAVAADATLAVNDETHPLQWPDGTAVAADEIPASTIVTVVRLEAHEYWTIVGPQKGGGGGTSEIGDGSVTEAKLADNSVSTRTIAANAVTEPKIMDRHVTRNKLAIDAVGTSEIEDGSVTAAKLASGAVPAGVTQSDIDSAIATHAADDNAHHEVVTQAEVTTAINTAISTHAAVSDAHHARPTAADFIDNTVDLADSSETEGVDSLAPSVNITGVHIRSLATNLENQNVETLRVQGGNLQIVKSDNRIVQVPLSDLGSGEIADDAVTTAKILDDAVTTAKILDGAVTTDKINDRAVTGMKLASGAIGYTPLGDRVLHSLPPAPPNHATATGTPADATASDVGKYVSLTSADGYGLVDAPGGGNDNHQGSRYIFVPSANVSLGTLHEPDNRAEPAADAKFNTSGIGIRWREIILDPTGDHAELGIGDRVAFRVPPGLDSASNSETDTGDNSDQPTFRVYVYIKFKTYGELEWLSGSSSGGGNNQFEYRIRRDDGDYVELARVQRSGRGIFVRTSYGRTAESTTQPSNSFGESGGTPANQALGENADESEGVEPPHATDRPTLFIPQSSITVQESALDIASSNAGIRIVDPLVAEFRLGTVVGFRWPFETPWAQNHFVIQKSADDPGNEALFGHATVIENIASIPHNAYVSFVYEQVPTNPAFLRFSLLTVSTDARPETWAQQENPATVPPAKLADRSIAGGKLAVGTVTGHEIAAGAVGVGALDNHAVTRPKLALNQQIPVGSLMMYGGTAESIPEGWLDCDGRTLNVVDHPELHAAIGTTYGQDVPTGDTHPHGAGHTQFKIPNFYHYLTYRIPSGPGPDRTIGYEANNGWEHQDIGTGTNPIRLLKFRFIIKEK